MIGLIARCLGGGRSARQIKKYAQAVAATNDLAETVAKLDADQLRAAADRIRQRSDAGEELEALLPEAFALIREAADSSLGLRPFDAQLLGACALNDGKIAEMKTGEGKTLAAVLPAGLQALGGMPVHVVTVNDYLAGRDAEWMQPVYAALGLSVGMNRSGATVEEKRAAYCCSVTYGTNNEFGFDMLRDNLRYEPLKCQSPHGFAIVDEVDSILIDEARTPLSISAAAGDLTPLYAACNELSRFFTRGEQVSDEETSGDFGIDEKTRAVHFSDAGYERAEKLFEKRGLLHEGGLYEAHNLQLMHHLIAALRARHLYQRDRDYLVTNGKVVIVDEHTGRPQPGRRWGEGLHQAIEAKERLAIEPESQSIASVTLQNYFRMYKKLAGMTGTAATEAEEFTQIYGLTVVPIPTHRPMIRADGNDRIYRTAAGKIKCIVEDIRDCHQRGQPVLVGTTSVANSELIAAELEKLEIRYNMLNAKHHASEARIIAQAGEPGSVTISANMAGRGTDIVLGGNAQMLKAEVAADSNLSDDERTAKSAAIDERCQAGYREAAAAGGLRIIGTERHESRRIDNQLRGRAGRQGDPGSSQFYLSLDDPLLRVFAAERMSKIMQALDIDEDEAIESKLVSRQIENAQRRIESYNYDIRKQLLEFDDITNDQRRILYAQREEILGTTDIDKIANELINDAVHSVCAEHMPAEAPEELWKPAAAEAEFKKLMPVPVPIEKWLAEDDSLDAARVADKAAELARAEAAARAADLGPQQSEKIIRSLIINTIDSRWRGHLAALDHLRQSIGLRGLAQKNPKQEYRREALELFNTMLGEVRLNILRILTTVTVSQQPAVQQKPAIQKQPAVSQQPAAPTEQPLRKPLRNDPCPCGSGRKYKNCCGRKR